MLTVHDRSQGCAAQARPLRPACLSERHLGKHANEMHAPSCRNTNVAHTRRRLWRVWPRRLGFLRAAQRLARQISSPAAGLQPRRVPNPPGLLADRRPTRQPRPAPVYMRAMDGDRLAREPRAVAAAPGTAARSDAGVDNASVQRRKSGKVAARRAATPPRNRRAASAGPESPTGSPPGPVRPDLNGGQVRADCWTSPAKW